MKIRITQSGYESFCGLLGDVKFDNGVSVSDASEQQVAYVAAMFTTETFEDEATAPQGEEVVDQSAAAKLAEAERLAAEAERERAEAEAAEAAAQAAAAEAAAAQVEQVSK